MSQPTAKHDFRTASRAAVNNEQLRAAVKTVTSHLSRNRAIGVAEYQGFEELRAWGREKKLEVSENLQQAADTFAARVEANGGQIYRAKGAEDVGRIVTQIARSCRARLAVKGKSMTAEEVGLNDFLAAAGTEVVETDLGEYIIQLAGEKPSHILAPAIHRSKAQISQLFSEALNAPENLDAKGLVNHARMVLRERFLAAGIGVTGANFAVAETGTLALVSNEGNGRMCSSLPPVHVVLVGIEKVIPKLTDLPGFLTLLTRSATGQPISTYVSLITGPRQNGDGEGPANLHVILLDNGRSKIAKGPYREMLHCLHCSSCLNHCPVYCSVGGHAWESPYPGPMGSVLSSLLWGRKSYPDQANACTLCGRCAEVCPVKIPLPGYHLKLRSLSIDDSPKKSLLSNLSAKIIVAPGFFLIGLAMLRSFLDFRPAALFARSFSGMAKAWLLNHDMPKAEVTHSFRRWWQSRDSINLIGTSRYLLDDAPGSTQKTGLDSAESWGSLDSASVSLFDQYVKNAKLAGTEVLLIPRAELVERLKALLAEESIASVALPSAGWPTNLHQEVLHIVSGSECRVVVPQSASEGANWDRAALAEASLGVMFCRTCLADNGSLLIPSGPGMGTLASLLPDISLMISSEDCIIENLGTYLENLDEPMPSRTTLITGPSRTGDIPGSMTMGVHGPRRLLHWITSE